MSTLKLIKKVSFGEELTSRSLEGLKTSTRDLPGVVDKDAEGIKVAIIGLGKIGALWENDKLRVKPATHLGAYLRHPECEIVGLADTDENRLKEIGQKFGITELYTDFEKMLFRTNPNIVSVCTPTDTHHKIVTSAVRYHGLKVIFCEKAIASTVDEAQDMLDKCDLFDVKLAINQTRRWDSTYRMIKNWIEQGNIGEVTHASAFFSGDMIRCGVHMADLLLWYKPKQVHITKCQGDYLIFELDLIGTAGRIRISDNGRNLQLFESRPSKHYEELNELIEHRGNFFGLPTVPLMNAIEDVVECSKFPTTKKQPECTGEDGLNALALCLNWYEQAKAKGLIS